MIGKAINSRYDYRQHSRKRPGYNYYSEKYSTRKDGVSMRVIDETTLRIYFPWVPEADLAIPLIAASSEHSIETIVYFKMKLSYTHLHILTRSTRCYLVKFCQNC